MKMIISIFIMTLLTSALLTSQPRLTVTTDSSLYEPGSEVSVSVTGPPHTPVALEVRGPRGELVALKQLTLDARGIARFAFLLDPECAEGIYTVYVALGGHIVTTAFEVIARPPPVILLAPPGQVSFGERAEILCFVYPGLQVSLRVYIRPVGGEWMLLGIYESNSSGWLVVPFDPPSEGVYEVKVEFDGTHDYRPASAIATFRVARDALRWKITVPPQKWLGENLVIHCEGFDYVIARTIAGEKMFACNVEVRLDTHGPLFLYPVKDEVLGKPSFTMVRVKLNTEVKAPQEVGVNEPFALAAHLNPPIPAVRVSFTDAEGTIVAEAITRANGTAIARVSFSRIEDYVIKAVPYSTSVFEVGDCYPSTIRVLGDRIYVRLTIVDAAQRKLYNSLVEIAQEQYEAPMGIAEFAVRAGEYDVKVYWRGFLVYSGRLALRESNVTLMVPLYDLKIIVTDFFGRQATGELVELYNGTERILVGTTGDDGQLIIIRIPPGIYTIKVGNVMERVSVPQVNEIRVVLPPSPLLIAFIALIIITIIMIAVTGVKQKRRFS